MTLIIDNKNEKQQKEETVNKYANYRVNEPETIDFYRKYKDDGYLPMKGKSNLRNLFDDLDVNDYYWFSLAKKYLSKK